MSFYQSLVATRPDTVRSLYRYDQAAEASRRVRRILDRIEAKFATPHGFYDPQGFMLATIIRGEQVAKAKSIYQRIRDKIALRDRNMTVSEMAVLLDMRRF